MTEAARSALEVTTSAAPAREQLLQPASEYDGHVHAEWEIMSEHGSGLVEAEVEVRMQDEGPAHQLQPQSSTLALGVVNGTPPYPLEEIPEQVIVRAEEILIVVLVLMIWVAAIALFFNRWGKIRMLEPYQPKFQQQHRSSCPMADSVISPQQRMSFSKYNVNCNDNALYANLPSPNPLRRPRQNSVFVGSSTMAVMNPPRRTKSAMDIQHLVLSEYSPGSLSGCTSLLPMMNKRPSITIETPCQKHRHSVVLEEPLGPIPSYPKPSRNYMRRPSCMMDRPKFTRHRHFISFDQPTTSFDKRTSVTIDRPLKLKKESFDQPSLVIEPPNQEIPIRIESLDEPHRPSTSRGFRRPSFHLETPIQNKHRLSVSLDHATNRLERRSSDTRSLKYEPVSTSFDETKIQINSDEVPVSDV